jgi:hypothetical protein
LIRSPGRDRACCAGVCLRGYIGAVLVPFFRSAGHQVDGLDLWLHAGCDPGPALQGARSPGTIDLTCDDFTSSRFVRLRRIKELMAAGAVDEVLRRPGPAS